MTLEPKKAESPTPSALELEAEYENLNKTLLELYSLQRQQKEGLILTDQQQQLIDNEPAMLRRAVDVTRLLRRTNTGPAKAKTTRAGKKAVEQATIDELMKL